MSFGVYIARYEDHGVRGNFKTRDMQLSLFLHRSELYITRCMSRDHQALYAPSAAGTEIFTNNRTENENISSLRQA